MVIDIQKEERALSQLTQESPRESEAEKDESGEGT
jgi:hypothetical protein